MKKIGIAVFALMVAGVSYAGAQEIEIDFDGKSDIQKSQSIQTMDKSIILEKLLDIEYNEIAIPDINLEYEDTNTQWFYKGLSDKDLNYSIRTAISHAKRIKEEGLKRNLETLLEKGTLKQKHEFVYWKNGVYKFPLSIVLPSKGVCRWVTSTVCEWSCEFVGSGDDAIKECKKDCHDILVEACD